MSFNTESTPEMQRYLLLGEREQNLYLGFRDAVTHRFSGMKLEELGAFGMTPDLINGVAVDPRDEYQVAAVRIPKKTFEGSTDLDGARGFFEHAFAVDIAGRMGGFVCERGIEPITEKADNVFVSWLEAKVDASQRTLENGALGDD